MLIDICKDSLLLKVVKSYYNHQYFRYVALAYAKLQCLDRVLEQAVD